MKHRSGWSLDQRDPKVIESLMPYWEWFYKHYFRVQSDGWEHIPPQGQFLFVGSHNGGLAAPDMVMTIYDWYRHFGSQRLVYGLMHPKVWLMNPAMADLAQKVGAISANPHMAIAAFHRGASVLVYPGGPQDVFRPHNQRNKIHFAERRGFIKLALRQEVPIIPIISYGAHDTLLVLTDCYEAAKFLHELGLPWLLDLDPEIFPIYLGLPWIVSLGPLPNFPLPAPIHLRVCPPIIFESYGRQKSRDRFYVDQCYQQVITEMQQALDQLVKEKEQSKMKK
jgi:1-acyl-sn-glycerol-3-phosphate acyltransferase